MRRGTDRQTDRQCFCLCVCVSIRGRMPTLSHGPGCNLGSGRGCPLVVHNWADLQSVHGFRCYDNIAPNAKCQRVLVLALCHGIKLHSTSAAILAAHVMRRENQPPLQQVDQDTQRPALCSISCFAAEATSRSCVFRWHCRVINERNASVISLYTA